MPDIWSTEGEAERFQSHRLIGDRSRKDHEVRPADTVAVLALDWPKKASSLIKICVVGERVQRCESQIASASSTATITDPVGPGGVPCHSDHQTAVVPPVGRPPGLALCHQRVHVALQSWDVELLKLLPVVKIRAERVGLGVMLMQDSEIQCLWPPGGVPASGLRVCSMSDWALRGVLHQMISSNCVRRLSD